MTRDESRPVLTTGEVKTHWFLVELRNLANPALGAIASVLFTLWTVQDRASQWSMPSLLFLLGAGAMHVVWVWGYFTWLRPRYSELAQNQARAEGDLRHAQAALQAALDSLLMHLLKDRSLDNPSCRVSAYSVEHDRFVLLSRRSVNPSLERRGRQTYPLEKGVIGQAWERQSARSEFEVESREEWEMELVSSEGFNADEARALTMFSRSILAVRVDSATDDKLGMLVFESESKTSFTASSADTLRRRPLFSAVADLIAGWHEHFPRAKEWNQERDGGPVVHYLTEPAWKNPR